MYGDGWNSLTTSNSVNLEVNQGAPGTQVNKQGAKRNDKHDYREHSSNP